jgi:hypothetical protein
MRVYETGVDRPVGPSWEPHLTATGTFRNAQLLAFAATVS